MPLFDLQWALSAINEKTLEQAGITANFFAGILLAIEYFVVKDRIDQLNDLLEVFISKAYSRSLRRVKLCAKCNRLIFITIIAVVVLMALYKIILDHDAILRDDIANYVNLVEPILIPLRRVLLVSLAMVSIMFVILFIAHSAPKRTLGALGILLYITGNILLFLHTIYM
ncbi:MAG: hypothetical protein EHM14_10235 [Methanothrix sp.]|nr:MAG: hypothetical protein EHM14_10235 [Methanothrix sp.]